MMSAATFSFPAPRVLLAVLACAAALSGGAPAPGQTQAPVIYAAPPQNPPPDPNQVQLLGKKSAVNLAKTVWYFLDSEPPGGAASLGQAKGAIPTTVPYVVRPSSGGGWLYANFAVSELEDRDGGKEPNAPGLKLLSSILTIGDAPGVEEIYVNGESVARFDSPEPPSAAGSPRRIVVPAKALRFGQLNRVALKLRPTVDVPDAGVASLPATLAALDWHESKARLDAALDLLARSYALRFQALGLGLENENAFRELNEDVNDLLAELPKAVEALRLRNEAVLGALKELDDVMEEMAPRCDSLEVKLLARRALYRREQGRQVAGRLGLPPDSLRTRPWSFGRFGGESEDGLPALWKATPVSVAPAPGAGFSVRLGKVDASETLDLDWEHKVSRVAGLNDPKAISLDGGASQDDVVLVYYMRTSSLFPGAMIDVVRGKKLVLELDAPGPTLGVFQFVALAPEFEECILARYFGDGEPQQTPEERSRQAAMLQALEREARLTLVVPRRPDASPMLLLHDAGTEIRGLRQVPDRPDKSLLVFQAKGPSIGKIVAIFPQGGNLIDASVVPEERPEDFLRRAFGNDYAKLLGAFFRFGARFPERVDEWHRVDREKGIVECVNLFHYIDVVPGLDGFHPAVLPPMIAQAKRDGYPVELSDNVSFKLRVPGVEGPFYLGESDGEPIRYSLPIPATGQRALPWSEGSEELRELLTQSAGQGVDLSASSSTLLGMFAQGRSQAWQAYSFVDQRVRQAMAEGEARSRAAFLSPALWTDLREPVSGRTVHAAHTTEGAYFQRRDMQLGNALILDEIVQASLYSGDWSWVEANKRPLRDYAFQLMAMADDWGWSAPGSSISGLSTGDGDGLNATLAGLRAYAVAMEKIGDEEQADFALYLLARAAAAATQRFKLRDYALRNNRVGVDESIVGFAESAGFVTAPMRGYPGRAVSNFSANGPNSFVMDVLVPTAGDEMRERLEAIHKTWPRWYDGEFEYGAETPLDGNSGAITLPLIHAYARLGEEPAVLEQFVRFASSNRSFWWMAPPVLAEIVSGKRGAWVEDWGRLGFEGAAFAENGRRLHADLSADADDVGQPQRVAIHLPKAPAAVHVDFKPFSEYQFDAATGRLTLDLVPLRASPMAVTVDLAPGLPAPTREMSRFVAVSRWPGFEDVVGPESLAEPEPMAPAAPASPTTEADSVLDIVMIDPAAEESAEESPAAPEMEPAAGATPEPAAPAPSSALIDEFAAPAPTPEPVVEMDEE